MKNLTKITLMLLAVGVLAGCSKNFYEADQLEPMKRKHRSMAVVPPDMNVESKSEPSASTSANHGNVGAAYKIQEILTQKLAAEAEDYTVTIMASEETNKALQAGNVNYFELYTTQSIKATGDVLGVDGIIKGEIDTPKPLKEEEQADNKKIKVKLMLYEANAETLLWSYEDKYEFNKYNTPEKLAKRIFDKISGKFPYKD